MKVRAVAVLGCLALAGTTVLTSIPASAQAPPSDERQTWIVELRPGAPARELAQPMVSPHGGRVDHVYELALNGFSFQGSSQAADALRRNPEVEDVTAASAVELVDGVPVGIMRIGGYQTLTDSPPQRGTMLDPPNVPVRVGVLDSGIDTDHPELQPFTAATSCAPGSPSIEDVIGHGTHVTGTVAARVNGTGIVGLAPEVEIVPVKVVEDATASGTDADVICGIDHVLSLHVQDGRPTVINMSLGDLGPVGDGCAATPMRQAVCNAVDAGITVVAAAGNNATDIGSNPFVPAAYPEVIAVSAYVDGDGSAGGSAGCTIDWSLLMQLCDDTMAPFSNRGAPIDVIAPGAQVYSTVPGGYGSKSGTSMASPHAAASAALVLAANPGLSPAQVREVLRATGECPDGVQATSAGSCAGHGGWTNDSDGIAEPLLDVDRATTLARSMTGPDTTAPSVSITSPAAGAVVRGSVTVSAQATDDVGVSSVELLVDGAVIATDTTAPHQATWDSTSVADGDHVITAVARDLAGNTATSAPVTVTVANAATTTTMRIGTLIGHGSSSRWSTVWYAWAEVTVLDQHGAGVAGATVHFQVTGGVSTTRSCTTDVSGRCTTEANRVQIPKRANSVTFTVVDVVKAGAVWDGTRWAVTLKR